MSALRVYVIRCDRCGVTFGTDRDRLSVARGLARAEGWTTPIYKPAKSQLRIDACPGCSEKAGVA